MAWRSSGDTNDELVRNLKREFTRTLCVTPAPGIKSFSHARKSRFDSIRYRASIDRMTYASDAWLLVLERHRIEYIY